MTAMIAKVGLVTLHLPPLPLSLCNHHQTCFIYLGSECAAVSPEIPPGLLFQPFKVISLTGYLSCYCIWTTTALSSMAVVALLSPIPYININPREQTKIQDKTDKDLLFVLRFSLAFTKSLIHGEIPALFFLVRVKVQFVEDSLLQQEGGCKQSSSFYHFIQCWK